MAPRGTEQFKNSGAVEYIAYFYVRPGESVDYKTCDKYVFEKKIVQNTDKKNPSTKVDAYKLVYYDEEGNPSYTFPKGTRIYVFLHTSEMYPRANDCECYKGRNWFTMGDMNIDMNQHRQDAHGFNANSRGGLDGWKNYSRVIYYNRGGLNYISVEDGTDFDYNDLLITVQGDIENFPDVSTVTKLNPVSYTYAYEDTKMGDYDYNDVVLNVKQGPSYPNVVVSLLAVGAADAIRIYYKDSKTGKTEALFKGKEVHEVYGIPAGSFVNTQSINFTCLPQ